MSEEQTGEYPKTATTKQGLVVDAGIADFIEWLVADGFTPRASCSGLQEDHAPESSATPYLSLQAAPTLDDAELMTDMPAQYTDADLVQRLQAVAERAGWHASTSLSWLLYPTVVFRLSPTRGDLKDQMFGPDRSFDSLSDEEEDRLDYRYDEANAEVDAISDTQRRALWQDLRTELHREFEGESLPSFEDNQAEFESAVEEYEDVFEMFFDSDDEFIQYVNSQPSTR